MEMDNVRKMIETAYDNQISRARLAGDTRRSEYASTANRRSAIAGLKGALANASIRNAQAKADELTNEQIQTIDSMRNKDLIGLAMKEDEIARAEEQARENRKLAREQAGWNALTGLVSSIGGTAGLLGLGANVLKTTRTPNYKDYAYNYGYTRGYGDTGIVKDDEAINLGAVSAPTK